jgi:hypothetical protein
MADSNNISMTQEEYNRAQAALDIYEKIAEVVDKTRGVSKKEQKTCKEK